MVQIYDIGQQKGYKLALRQYSPEGKYFLIKFSRITGDILQIEELTELPGNWSQDYINELIETGKILKSKVF